MRSRRIGEVWRIAFGERAICAPNHSTLVETSFVENEERCAGHSWYDMLRLAVSL